MVALFAVLRSAMILIALWTDSLLAGLNAMDIRSRRTVSFDWRLGRVRVDEGDQKQGKQGAQFFLRSCAANIAAIRTESSSTAFTNAGDPSAWPLQVWRICSMAAAGLGALMAQFNSMIRSIDSKALMWPLAATRYRSSSETRSSMDFVMLPRMVH